MARAERQRQLAGLAQPAQQRRGPLHLVHGLLDQCRHRQVQQRHADQQGQQQPARATLHQAAHAVARQRARRQHAGDDEEQRHAHQVQRPQQQVQRGRLRGVGGGEEGLDQRAVRQRGVEQQAGQHGRRAQRVEGPQRRRHQ